MKLTEEQKELLKAINNYAKRILETGTYDLKMDRPLRKNKKTGNITFGKPQLILKAK